MDDGCVVLPARLCWNASVLTALFRKRCGSFSLKGLLCLKLCLLAVNLYKLALDVRD